jgi:hypothetical protein
MPNLLFADASYIVPINIIIWSICIGANLGFLYSYYSKNIVGSFVRKLLSCARGEENAKTLSELGSPKFTLFHKVILKDGSYLRNTISVVGGSIPKAENTEGESAVDWESAKFYIPSSKQDKATLSYGTAQKWIFLPIFGILSVLLSVAMTFIMPILLAGLPLI